MGEGTCTARTRIRLTTYGESHTLPCQKEAGHDGAHEHKRDLDQRTIYWFGDQAPPDNTRFRFGRWLEAK